MSEREKVIRGLECCIGGFSGEENFEKCQYRPHRDGCKSGAIMDALTLLKAQEPRVMTLEELPDWDGAFLIETRAKGATVWASWYSEYELYDETVCRMVDIGGEVDDRFKKLYGYGWRVWTSRPTDEQREATPWE